MEPYYQDDWVTLYHGNCLDFVDVWTGANVLVTDPPYGSENNTGYGRSGGNGRTGNFLIAGDADTHARDAALEAWGDRPVACFGTPRMPEPPGEWSDRLVWDKREPGLNGGPWRYTHESIFVRGDGWVRRSARSFSVLSVPSGNGSEAKRWHAHAKPVPLMEALIDAWPGGVVADPFAGSGSTLVAARNLGRRIIGVEIAEEHCERTALRLERTPPPLAVAPAPVSATGAFDLEGL